MVKECRRLWGAMGNCRAVENNCDRAKGMSDVS